eukprot:gene7080-176_t
MQDKRKGAVAYIGSQRMPNMTNSEPASGAMPRPEISTTAAPSKAPAQGGYRPPWGIVEDFVPVEKKVVRKVVKKPLRQSEWQGAVDPPSHAFSSPAESYGQGGGDDGFTFQTPSSASHLDSTPVGRGRQTSHFDNTPVGGGRQNSHFDNTPVGGGRQSSGFDNTPVGARHGADFSNTPVGGRQAPPHKTPPSGRSAAQPFDTPASASRSSVSWTNEGGDSGGGGMGGEWDPPPLKSHSRLLGGNLGPESATPGGHHITPSARPPQPGRRPAVQSRPSSMTHGQSDTTNHGEYRSASQPRSAGQTRSTSVGRKAAVSSILEETVHQTPGQGFQALKMQVVNLSTNNPSVMVHSWACHSVRRSEPPKSTVDEVRHQFPTTQGHTSNRPPSEPESLTPPAHPVTDEPAPPPCHKTPPSTHTPTASLDLTPSASSSQHPPVYLDPTSPALASTHHSDGLIQFPSASRRPASPATSISGPPSRPTSASRARPGSGGTGGGTDQVFSGFGSGMSVDQGELSFGSVLSAGRKGLGDGKASLKRVGLLERGEQPTEGGGEASEADAWVGALQRYKAQIIQLQRQIAVMTEEMTSRGKLIMEAEAVLLETAGRVEEAHSMGSQAMAGGDASIAAVVTADAYKCLHRWSKEMLNRLKSAVFAAPCAVFAVLCSQCCVRSAVFAVLCSQHLVLCSQCCVRSAVFAAPCAVFAVLCSQCCVRSTLCCVRSAVFAVLCSQHLVLWVVFAAPCAVFAVLCSQHLVLCSQCCVRSTLCCVRSAVFAAPCAVFAVLCSQHLVLCSQCCVRSTLCCVRSAQFQASHGLIRSGMQQQQQHHEADGYRQMQHSCIYNARTQASRGLTRTGMQQQHGVDGWDAGSGREGGAVASGRWEVPFVPAGGNRFLLEWQHRQEEELMQQDGPGAPSPMLRMSMAAPLPPPPSVTPCTLSVASVCGGAGALLISNSILAHRLESTLAQLAPRLCSLAVLLRTVVLPAMPWLSLEASERLQGEVAEAAQAINSSGIGLTELCTLLPTADVTFGDVPSREEPRRRAAAVEAARDAWLWANGGQDEGAAQDAEDESDLGCPLGISVERVSMALLPLVKDRKTATKVVQDVLNSHIKVKAMDTNMCHQHPAATSRSRHGTNMFHPTPCSHIKVKAWH